VAVAVQAGWVAGMPDGKFHPGDPVSNAQFLTMLVRALGRNVDARLGWPQAPLAAARAAEIIPAGDDIDALANQPATRGRAFFYANRAFLLVRLPSGKTVYQTHVKPEPPALSVEAPESTTAPRLTLKGSAPGAAAVTLNGEALTLTGGGSFSKSVDLALGENRFTVAASDLVGNVTTQVVTVTRTNTAPAAVQVTPGNLTLAAGATASLTVAVLDTYKNPIPGLAVTAQVSPETLGTYDPATQTFTAGARPGSGTLTLTHDRVYSRVPITVTAGPLARIEVSPADSALGSGQVQTFTARGFDRLGNEVPLGDVRWSASGGVMEPQTGRFAGTAPGPVTVTATSGGVTGSTRVTVAGKATALQVTADGDLVANGAGKVTLTVRAVDGAGHVDPTFTDWVDLVLTDSVRYDLSATRLQLQQGVARVELRSTVTTPGQAVGVQARADKLTTGTLTLTPLAQRLGSVAVSQDFTRIPGDGSSYATLTLTALDEQGAPMVGTQMPAGLTVDLDLSGAGFRLLSLTGAELPEGRVTFPVGGAQVQVRVQSSTGGTAAATITGRVITPGLTAIPVGSASIASAYAGQPYRLRILPVAPAMVGTMPIQAVKVVVEDQDGTVLRGGYGETINISLAAAGGGKITLDARSKAVGADNAATFFVADTKAETVTYTATATWGGLRLQSATAKGEFTPGPATAMVLTATRTNRAGEVWLRADGQDSATVTIRLVDTFGNPTTTGHHTLTVRQTGTYFTQSIGPGNQLTLTTAGGTASFTVRSAQRWGDVAGFDTFEVFAPGFSSPQPLKVRATISGS
jgi:hypothetical protein